MPKPKTEKYESVCFSVHDCIWNCKFGEMCVAIYIDWSYVFFSSQVPYLLWSLSKHKKVQSDKY